VGVLYGSQSMTRRGHEQGRGRSRSITCFMFFDVPASCQLLTSSAFSLELGAYLCICGDFCFKISKITIMARYGAVATWIVHWKVKLELSFSNHLAKCICAETSTQLKNAFWRRYSWPMTCHLSESVIRRGTLFEVLCSLLQQIIVI
jgi:hypothetical protein